MVMATYDEMTCLNTTYNSQTQIPTYADTNMEQDVYKEPDLNPEELFPGLSLALQTTTTSHDEHTNILPYNSSPVHVEEQKKRKRSRAQNGPKPKKRKVCRGKPLSLPKTFKEIPKISPVQTTDLGKPKSKIPLATTEIVVPETSRMFVESLLSEIPNIPQVKTDTALKPKIPLPTPEIVVPETSKNMRKLLGKSNKSALFVLVLAVILELGVRKSKTKKGFEVFNTELFYCCMLLLKPYKNCKASDKQSVRKAIKNWVTISKSEDYLTVDKDHQDSWNTACDFVQRTLQAEERVQCLFFQQDTSRSLLLDSFEFVQSLKEFANVVYGL